MALFHNVCLSTVQQLRPCSLKSGTTNNMFPKYFITKPSPPPRKCPSCSSSTEWSMNEDLSLTHTQLPYGIDGKRTGKFSDEHERKIDETRQWLQSVVDDEEDSMGKLIIVDTIQRVGVSNHFQKEIKLILQQHYKATGGCVEGLHTLHEVSLSFRLFRQHGYHVSADVFTRFKGVDNWEVKNNIKPDMNGLIEFYEAAQMSFDGEHQLDEAASININQFEPNQTLDYNWSMLNFRLSHPYHKSIEGLPEKYFLENLLGVSSWENSLRELAAMDLDKRKLAYQQELHHISEWWNGLNIASELKLVRNQPLKWYTWSMAALIDDASLSKPRVELTKAIALIYLIDDIFDLYGTPDELKIFTEAVHKWDYAAIDTLPDYMKMCYTALLDTINEIAHNIHQDHGHNPIVSLKKTWAVLCNAFLVEAEWFDSGEVPTAQVYLENGIVSSGAHVVPVHLFYLLGLGGISNKEAFSDFNDIPDELISSAATILRLWDDFGSAKDEHQDGKDGSYIDYYMKENEGQTVEQVHEHVQNSIARAWKRLNKECFRLNHGPALSLKKACLNLARMIPLMYNYDDKQSLPVLREYVKFMLFNHK